MMHEEVHENVEHDGMQERVHESFIPENEVQESMQDGVQEKKTKWRRMKPNPRVRRRDEGRKELMRWKPHYKGKELDRSDKAVMQRCAVVPGIVLPRGVMPNDPEIEWVKIESYEEDE